MPYIYIYIYIYEYYSALKREWNSDACYNMNEPWNIMLSKISQTLRDKYYMVPLMWST